MTATHYFDNRHHHHRPSSSTSQDDHFHQWPQPSTSKVPSCIDGFERRNRSSIKSHSSIAVGLSTPPLIHPFRHSTTPMPINNGQSKVHSPCHHSTSHCRSLRLEKTHHLVAQSTSWASMIVPPYFFGTKKRFVRGGDVEGASRRSWLERRPT